ncbi:fibroblast growth factor 7 [Salminus brasiliensis]|uniref:fibroblast growth factor 7 n=1 Tax=Salminus brasiliensis TaxID=930266 RepID=UPI003B83305D
MMHRWIVERKRPDLLLFVLCLRALLWICGLDVALADHSALCNCSRHERHTRNYDYMEGGDVRTRRLYSRTQWFLTIDQHGNISGTQDPNDCYSILEIRSVSEGGVLAIKGVKSQYFISMRNNGVLYGTKEYTNSCIFKEVFLENFYTAYSSNTWTTKDGKEMFISLSQKGRPLRGKKTRKESIASHFIPRKCKEDGKTLA